MDNKEVRRGRNHNQWKRGIAAGHVGVVDYISSRILAKVSCSQALPTPDDPFRVCELSEIALLLHKSIIVKNKIIILYFYIYVFLVVHQDQAIIYNKTIQFSTSTQFQYQKQFYFK